MNKILVLVSFMKEITKDWILKKQFLRFLSLISKSAEGDID